MLGSGTQGLQSRTRSPPPRPLKSAYPPSPAIREAGYSLRYRRGAPGGCTMYWYGMVMRCGEQASQTTRPHFLTPRKHANRTHLDVYGGHKPAMVLPDKEAELCVADRTVRHLSIGLPPGQRNRGEACHGSASIRM